MIVWQNKKKNESIDALCRLTPKRRFELLSLDYVCRQHDGTESVAELEAGIIPNRSFRSFFLYYDGKRLAGELYLFLTEENGAEITAIVDPYRRRNGIFTALLKAASAELKKYGITEYCFVAEPACRDASDAAAKMGLSCIRSETVMELSGADEKTTAKETDATEAYREASGDDGESAGTDNISNGDENITCTATGDGFEIRMADTDGSFIGSAACCMMNGTAFIHNVGVEASLRSKGYGRKIMTAMIAKIRQTAPNAVIRLQVTSDNTSALGLYESLGFKTVSRLDYLQ